MGRRGHGRTLIGNTGKVTVRLRTAAYERKGVIAAPGESAGSIVVQLPIDSLGTLLPGYV